MFCGTENQTWAAIARQGTVTQHLRLFNKGEKIIPEIPDSKPELQKRYDASALRYDLEILVYELLAVRKLRREIIKRASGNVLEVSAGTGKNFPHYEKNIQLTATDMSAGMLALAVKRAENLRLNAAYAVMDGEVLSFADNTFDTVVSSLTLCTFYEPVAALREMARVCKTDGRILLLEHGKSSNGWLARFQDKMADRHAARLGCWWNREPQEIAKQAGLSLTMTKRVVFGVFHIMEAVPNSAKEA